jgi:hypothetical protein
MKQWRKQTTKQQHKANKPNELNAAISQLWQDQATHTKDSFNQHIVPIYTQLLEKIKQHQSNEAAEQQLLNLLNNTAKACRYRWTLRLPLKRPGSDYRKYEIVYTDALVTAMAIDCLKHHQNEPPEQLAETLIPRNLLNKFKADPIVWQDWLGYFQQAEQGGLYVVSIQKRPEKPIRKPQTKKPTVKAVPKPPPPGSGRAMLDAIKTALNDGTLSYNQPGDAVQVDREGRTFLEHPRILKWCNDQLQLNEDLKKLKSRFSRLKVLNRSEQGKQLLYGRQHKRDRRRIGYVVENPSIIWTDGAPSGTFCIENLGG